MAPLITRLAFPHELGLAVTQPKGTDLVLTISATVPKGLGLGATIIDARNVVPHFKVDPAQAGGAVSVQLSAATAGFTVHFAGGSVEQLSFAKGQSQPADLGWARSPSGKCMARRGSGSRLVVMAIAASTQPGRLRFEVNAANKLVNATFVADAHAPCQKRPDGQHLVAGELVSTDLGPGFKLSYNNEVFGVLDEQAPDHVVVIDLALAASTLG